MYFTNMVFLRTEALWATLMSQPMPNLVDGKDIAITKAASMIDWQENLTRTLQNATTETNEN